MIYRRATLTDIDELVANRIDMRQERENDKDIADQCDFQERTYSYFRKHISDDSYISWIALDEDKVVATSGLCFYFAPPTYKNPSGIVAYIMNMYTKPEYRNKGIATKLLGYIVEEAKSRNCIKITLNASDMGRPVYEKFGFIDIKDDMVMYLE